jgi:hypothetical protein
MRRNEPHPKKFRGRIAQRFRAAMGHRTNLSAMLWDRWAEYQKAKT